MLGALVLLAGGGLEALGIAPRWACGGAVNCGAGVLEKVMEGIDWKLVQNMVVVRGGVVMVLGAVVVRGRLGR